MGENCSIHEVGSLVSEQSPQGKHVVPGLEGVALWA